MADLLVESAPPDVECRALVQKIVASREFQKAAKLRDFLVHVVDRKLACAPHEATEAVIGHRVFGRAASYNTGEDSIVRTQARLLRQRLERYFSDEGAAEQIILEIPKGSYVPVFHRRIPAFAAPAPLLISEPLKPRRKLALWLWLSAVSLTGTLLVWFIHSRAPRSPTCPLIMPRPSAPSKWNLPTPNL